MAPRVVIDLETASLLELPAVGSHVYASHPSTRVTVLCYAIDQGPVQTWTAGPCPDDLMGAIINGGKVVAHNYMFEFCIWAAKLEPLGFPCIPLAQWSCTMARALVAGLPARLELACPALNLPIQKDASARRLMLKFARPRSLDPLTWWHETDPVGFAGLLAYCEKDVAAERGLDQAIPELSRREYEIFLADHQINQRGMRVDLPLVRRMQALTETEKRRINDRLNRVTRGEITSGAQVSRLIKWLQAKGVTVPLLDKHDGSEPKPTLGGNSIDTMLAVPGQPVPVQTVLRCRRDMARSSTAKLIPMIHRLNPDRRVRGGFQYYGANRTGRWAGRGVQWQNFPRGTIKDPSTAVELIGLGADVETLEALYEDSPMGVVASCLRSAIEAAPGHMLVSCDLSQIEARVLVWLAGQDDMLDVFRRGEDIYTYTARRLGSTDRQLGKVLVLACGFGMGARRFQATARSFDIEMEIGVADDAVQAWRKLNHRVVNLWWEAHKTALRVVNGMVGSAVTYRGMGFTKRADSLDVMLPCGRSLVYREARVERHPDHGHEELVYRGVEQGRWTWLRSWPGKLIENIVQAVARDVMAETIIRAHKAGLPLVGTVHDELIAEVPAYRAHDAQDWLLAEMNRTPRWAPGLPVAATATIGRRYRKD